MKILRRFLTNRSAATAIEYALIAGGISIVILGAVNTLGTTNKNSFESVSAALK